MILWEQSDNATETPSQLSDNPTSSHSPINFNLFDNTVTSYRFSSKKLLNPYSLRNKPSTRNPQEESTEQDPQDTDNQDTKPRKIFIQKTLKTKLKELLSNEHQGDKLENYKDNTCRIVLNNIQGLSPTLQHLKATNIGRQARKFNIGILGLPETNYNWNDPQRASQVYQRIRKEWNPISPNQASNKHRSPTSHHIQGGCATIVHGKWASYVREKSTDDSGLGRWATTTLQGKDNVHVSIITAYCPPKNNKNAGPDTAWAQQWAHL